MAAPVFPSPFQPWFRLINGTDLNTLFGNPQFSSQATITAHAGGGRTSAAPISATISNFSTIANAGDSSVLPVAKAGSIYFVSNNGANAMQVFGNGSDTIDGIAGATGISMPAGQDLIFVCVLAGQWDGYGASDVGVFTTIVLNGATSGTTTLQASAIAGTTTQTLPAVTGTIASTTGTNLYIADIYRGTALTITNSITPTQIPGLTATVVVGTYSFKASIPCTPAATGGIAVSFVLATAVLSACNFQSTAGAAAASVTQSTTTATSTTNVCAVATIPLQVKVEGSFTVSTAGTISLFGCQNTQVNSTATVNLGSIMELTRIA